MANYHFSVDIVKRSAGRSSVAAAAYRSGEKLIDFRTGKRYDFRHKDDVTHKTIMLPECAPSWMKDRQALWNYVEQFEKRTDAQLCRDVNFDLPKELTTEQNIELAEKFVQEMLVAKGMIADLAIHTKNGSDGCKLSHAHVLLTMREVSEKGFGLKNREWNSKDLLQDWRVEWANYANEALSLNGHRERITHLSLAEQGIALEPQNRRGNENYKFNDRRKAEHERIARDNAERILADPSIAIKALTRNQAIFSTKDISEIAKRYSAHETQQAELFNAIRDHSDLVQIFNEKTSKLFNEKTARLCTNETFTSKKMLDLEIEILNKANEISIRSDHDVGKIPTTKLLSEQQQKVLDYLIAAGDMKCVIGYAGSGKSYLLGAAREVWEQSGYKVEGLTLSGIAASGLQASSGIESRTLASRMSYWNKNEQMLDSNTVLVVDEAGMLGSRQIARILKEVEKAQAKVVFVGDTKQLQAIEAGSPFRALVERFPTADLTEVKRQTQVWQQEATKEFGIGHTEKAINRYVEKECFIKCETEGIPRAVIEESGEIPVAISEMVDYWKDARKYYPAESQIMLAYTKNDVQLLNEQARQVMKEKGEVRSEMEFNTIYKTSDNLALDEDNVDNHHKIISVGVNDRILFLQNDRVLGVANGDLGTVKNIDGRMMTVELDQDKKEVIFDTEVYKHFDHGYATTIYKAQGVTVDATYLLASKHIDSYATYVAMSRHREELKVFWDEEEFGSEQALIGSMSRKREKSLALESVKPLKNYVDACLDRERFKEDKEKWEALNDKAQKLAHNIANDVRLSKVTENTEVQKSIERDAIGYQTSQQIAQELAMHNSQDRGMDWGMGW